MPLYKCPSCHLDATINSKAVEFTHDAVTNDDGRADVTIVTARCQRCAKALDSVVIRARFDRPGHWVIFMDDLDVNDGISHFDYPDECHANGEDKS